MSLTPHIPVDELSERHAYATLLLYGDWKHGEQNLLRNCNSALERLQQIWSSLPLYVTISLDEKKIQEQVFSAIPQPNEVAVDTTDIEINDFDSNFRRRPPAYEGLPEEQIDSLDWKNNSNYVLRNTNNINLNFLKNFIDSRIEEFRTTTSKHYSMTDIEFQAFLSDASLHIPIDNDFLHSEELDIITTKMNLKQLQAFNTVTSHLTDENSQQMVMLLTGPGGSGNDYIF